MRKVIVVTENESGKTYAVEMPSGATAEDTFYAWLAEGRGLPTEPRYDWTWIECGLLDAPVIPPKVTDHILFAGPWIKEGPSRKPG